MQKERIARGWTVEQLAQKAGMSDRRLRDIEKTSDTVALQNTIFVLAKCLEIAPTELGRPPADDERPAARPAARASSEAPASPRRPIGPLHEPTQLETLVAIERETPPRPPLATADGWVEPLTAKRMQDVFTAYAARAGSRFYATGRVITHRGLPDAECSLFDAKRGLASRVFLFTPVDGDDGLSITVHAREAAHTLFLQERKDLFVTVVVRLVLAPEEVVRAGAGFTFFQSKTPREWALVVEDVLDATDPSKGKKGRGAPGNRSDAA